jgi:DNA-binding PadR family transcriptional regulator
MGDPSDERGGKARRYYAVTPAGLKAIRATHDALASMTRGLESVLSRR